MLMQPHGATQTQTHVGSSRYSDTMRLIVRMESGFLTLV